MKCIPLFLVSMSLLVVGCEQEQKRPNHKATTEKAAPGQEMKKSEAAPKTAPAPLLQDK